MEAAKRLRFGPVSRHLQNLNELVEKDDVSQEIKDEVHRIIELTVVRK